ncbi:MAG: hypothetical protein AAB686_02775, partial [Patescibacteria group bacterium]
MLNRKLVVGLVVLVIILVALAVWVGMKLNKTDDAGSSAYSAVLLINGDVYFGKLSWFPTPRIEGAWILQRSVDEKNQVQLNL